MVIVNAPLRADLFREKAESLGRRTYQRRTDSAKDNQILSEHKGGRPQTALFKLRDILRSADICVLGKVFYPL